MTKSRHYDINYHLIPTVNRDILLCINQVLEGMNMAVHSIEDLLPKAGGSVYRLVRMAANRALELSEGKKRLIENPVSDKITTIALEEIEEGLVVYKKSAELLKTEEPKVSGEEVEDGVEETVQV